MKTRRLVRTDSLGRPPRLSHSSWTMKSVKCGRKGLEDLTGNGLSVLGRGYRATLLVGMMALIDDLRKSRGLHSVSAYRHGLYIYIIRSMPAGVAQSSHAFVGGTVSTWGR